MKKSVFKRGIAVALTLVLSIASLPVTAFAETTTISTETEVEEEYIYYSDLFYGYSYYLANAPYLTAYYNDTQGILNQIYDDYMDSPNFAWTNIKNSLAMATDLKEWAKMITDASGLTSFTYEKALDAANVDFATQLIGGSEIAKAYGTELKWVKKINDILKVYDTFDKNYDISVMTETEVFTAMFATIGDSGLLMSIDKTILITLQKDILPHISTITRRLSKGADILTAAKTIATGIMMEDFRMELIDEILSSTPSGTMLDDGMYRLKNQLRNGFVSYFLDQYLTDEVLNEIADKVVKKITGTVLEDQAGTYALIGAITKVASWIVFDCIFDVPDIDDLTKQMVLSEYAYNLYTLLTNKVAAFNTQFDTEDIYNLEDLATAYSAATNAALDASDKLKLSTNEAVLKTITDTYSGVVFYNEWIESAKSFVSNTSDITRVVTDFGTWEVDSDALFLQASDWIERGFIYTPLNGIKANIHILRPWWTGSVNSFEIVSGNDVVIDGDIIFRSMDSSYYGDTVFLNNGNVKVTGNIITNVDGTYSVITNNGSMEVKGNINVSALNMTGDESVLKVGGDLNAASTSLSQGTVVFNGSKEQGVNINSWLNNIEVTNPAGIKYLSDIWFRGYYKLNHNPLNCGEYFTIFENGAVFADDSDYKNVMVRSSARLTSSVKANIHILRPWWTGSVNSFEIVSGNDVVIDGDIIFRSMDSSYYGDTVFLNNGNVKVTGNIITNVDGTYSVITNNGSMEVKGNINVSALNMTGDESVLKVGGDLNAASTSLSQGTVVFNGSKEQKVSGGFRLDPLTLIISNTTAGGVLFATRIAPSFLFDHQGNNFTLYNNGNGSTFVDYDGDGLKDNVDPEPTVGNPCTLHFRSENDEKGVVSSKTVETMGGQKITVTATPSFKYNFARWIDSAGNTVSTSPECVLIAKRGETYTAIFTKRQQPIFTQANGGVIGVVSAAEIESEVTVTVSENDGYVYREGSLVCNGIPVENGRFIMPDEAVVLTAEFIKNEHYFALKETLSTAKGYAAQSYSHKSYSRLTEAIDVAEMVLVNTISLEESNNQIALLQAAIEGLEVKHTSFIGMDRYFPYTIKDGKATIIEVDTSLCGDITIPSTLGGCPVTNIGDGAFWGCSALTGVIIPDGVKSLGEDAFAHCNLLTRVTIPNSVTSIGARAFNCCTSLTSVKLPDGVTIIPEDAFCDCTSLMSVTIPDSVTKVGEYAFLYCDSLTDVWYRGTVQDKESLGIGPNNDIFREATWHYYTGWKKESGKWAYYKNGVKAKNQWAKDSKGWCYLGANGYMVTNKWQKDSVGWCYLGANGYMVKNQWAKDSNGWCYLGANGYMVKNQWQKDSKGWCYLGANGYMVKNKWVKDSKGWCYVGANGYCVTNAWKKDSVGWCYLDADGRMAKSQWVKDGGKWYYLNAKGYMVTGKQTIGGKTYTFNASGVWVG